MAHADAQLFMALAREAEHRLGNFNPQDLALHNRHNAQDLANTLWAFAIMGRQDAPLFATLAQLVEQCVDNFKM